ncbi:SH3 domain-containing protein [Paenibacillus sp. WLX1005]|uniref:C40 family peptidase n=1 Tax=Paenibacillus sp. WLX1005 TaxID=3243766 RepID=UPI0039843F65
MKRKLITLLTAAVLLTSAPDISQAAVTTVPVGKVNMPVNFRSGPNTDSSVYSTLQPGTSIKVLRQVNNYWLRVKVGVKTGYVSASYIDYKPSAEWVAANSSTSVSTKDSDTTTSGSATGNGTVTNASSSVVKTGSNVTASAAPTGSAPSASLPTSTVITPPAVHAPGTGLVERGVNFRAEPTTGSAVLRVLPVGESFSALEQPSAAWIKIQDKDGITGYVSADYVSYTLPASQTAVLAEVPSQTVDEVDAQPFNPPAPSISFPSLSTGSPLDEASADRIIASALALQGVTQYGFGKNEAPTLFDCSSFTRYIFGLEGIDLAWGTRYQKDVGIEVERGQWQKGDLLFFSGGDPNVITHVGIYAGDNKLIHNSPSLNGIAISNLDLQYWVDHYVTARRILR